MKQKMLVGFFIGLFFLSISLIVIETYSPNATIVTGYATSGSTTSNVTISKYFSIAMSTNLTSGITFGTVSSLPSTNVNATHNDDASGNTSMFINVSTDSNTNVDFCIRANADLTDPSSSDIIGLGNETYANATSLVSGQPFLGNETSLTTSYVKSGFNVSIGGDNYYKLWLDLPAGTSSGDYNNTVDFKAVETAVSC